MKVYEEYQYGGYRECFVTAPLRYSGGNLGGGTESIVVEDKVVNEDGKGNVWESDSMASLTTTGGKPGQGYPCVRQNIYPIEGNGSRESHQGRGYSESNKMYTLNTVEQHAVAQVSIEGGQSVACDIRNQKEDSVNGALQSKASNNIQSNNVVRQQYAVRRLTPLECERLQSLPDGWSLIDHKSCSDSARYKALGNGMSQNIPDWILRRLTKAVEEECDGD